MNPVVIAVLATVAIFLFALSLAGAAYISFRIVKAAREIGHELGLASRELSGEVEQLTLDRGRLVGQISILSDAVILLSKFPDDTKEVREAIECMPEFAKGIEAVAKDQVAALVGMRETIDLFRKQMFSNSPGGLQEYDDGKAALDDDAYEEQARVGCDLDEARERVKNRNLYKNMRIVKQ